MGSLLKSFNSETFYQVSREHRVHHDPNVVCRGGDVGSPPITSSALKESVARITMLAEERPYSSERMDEEFRRPYTPRVSKVNQSNVGKSPDEGRGREEGHSGKNVGIQRNEYRELKMNESTIRLWDFSI